MNAIKKRTREPQFLPLAPEGTLRRVRQTARISAKDVADRMGYSLTTLTNIERSDMGEVQRFIHPDERNLYYATIQEILAERHPKARVG